MGLTRQGGVLSPGGTGTGACAASQVMPIPAARHPTLLAAEIMESQYHLCWQNLLRASSPTILPALSSCSRNGSCTQGWAILVFQSSRLCHLKRNLELFPLNQLIRAQRCTAALGPPRGTAGTSNTSMSVHRDGEWGSLWCQQPSPRVSSAPAPSHSSVSPRQSPTALVSACLGKASASAWR